MGPNWSKRLPVRNRVGSFQNTIGTSWVWAASLFQMFSKPIWAKLVHMVCEKYQHKNFGHALGPNWAKCLSEPIRVGNLQNPIGASWVLVASWHKMFSKPIWANLAHRVLEKTQHKNFKDPLGPNWSKCLPVALRVGSLQNPIGASWVLAAS